jgi:GAF domain-containing protein
VQSTAQAAFSREDFIFLQTMANQLANAIENARLFEQMQTALREREEAEIKIRQILVDVQHHSELLQTAAEVSRAASSILDIHELIDTSVNLIRDHFDFYYVGMFLVDEAGEWAVLRAGTGAAGQIQLAKGHRLKIDGASMIGWSIAHRQARIALDVGEEKVHFRNPILPDTHSEMALPLISRGEVFGALTVQSLKRNAFSQEDITLLQTMADQLANALTNARLFEEAETRLSETQALQQLSQKLARTLAANEILEIFFRACTQEIGFEYVQFSLVDKARRIVKAISGVGVLPSQLERAVKSLDSHDIMADIIRTGRTEIITGWDDRFDKEIFETEGHENWMRIFTPVSLRQENIGLVEAGFKDRRTAIDEAQVRLLNAFINQTALALDNAQRYEASQKRAQREALIKEITTRVRASTDLDTILQTTVKEVGAAMGGQRTYIQLLPPKESNGNPSNASPDTGRIGGQK